MILDQFQEVIPATMQVRGVTDAPRIDGVPPYQIAGVSHPPTFPANLIKLMEATFYKNTISFPRRDSTLGELNRHGTEEEHF